MSENSIKKFQCPVCGKTFTKPHTVKVHMRLHTGQRPHECQVCSKLFVTASALKDHMISHVTGRGFICNRCGAKFKHKGTLKRHQTQHDKYEKKRKVQEHYMAEDLDPDFLFEEPPPKCFVISAEEGQERFPYLQDFFSQRSPEINTHEITSAEDSHPTVVKQERIVEEEDEDTYGAAVFEFTEDKFQLESFDVKVYNITSKVKESDKVSSVVPKKPKPLLPPNFLSSSKLQSSDRELGTSSPPDVAVRYGSHVSRILRLLDSQEKQAALIKRLNQTLHSFIIKRRK